MKKKVLFYSLDKRDSTAWWRTGGVLPYIHHADFEIIDISDTKIFDWTLFVGKSALILQRPFSSDHSQVITAAKNAGLKIILDLDDDLWAVPMWNPTYTMYKNCQASLNTCFVLADEVWASTASIAESVRKVNSNVLIIPNALNDYAFPVEGKRKYTPNRKALWRGGSSHAADVEEYEDLLIDRMNEHKDWEFTFIGDVFHRIARKTGDNCSIMHGLTITEFFRYLNEQNPSVMFFPLQDNTFNRGKSNIAWIESVYSGAAFYGNTALPEYIPGTILPIQEFLDHDDDIWEFYNRNSWDYIQENLLLSDINKLRIDGIIRNL